MAIDYKGPVEYSIELAIEKICELLKASYFISKRSVTLLLLQDDEEIKEMVRKSEGEAINKIDEVVKEAKSHFANPITYELALERQNEVRLIIEKTVNIKKEVLRASERLSQLTMNPITGIPILLFVLYWGLYKFVGQFGAGTVVNFLEGTLFDKYLSPFFIKIAAHIIPWKILQELFCRGIRGNHVGH